MNMTIKYVMQDGRLFYVADSPEGIDADDCEQVVCIFRVRDGFVADAEAAREWFFNTHIEPNHWLVNWITA